LAAHDADAINRNPCAGRAADDEPAVCAWGRRRRGRKRLCVYSTTYL